MMGIHVCVRVCVLSIGMLSFALLPHWLQCLSCLADTEGASTYHAVLALT